jgi:hypothetical protein
VVWIHIIAIVFLLTCFVEEYLSVANLPIPKANHK